MARFALKLSCAAAVAVIGHADDVDKPILLAPPASTSGTTAMMVFIPGGLVPNEIYVPVMQELQNELQGKIDLWVSIPACNDHLCVPFGSFPNVTAALQAGVDASGVSPEQTWLGGHSLGGASGDMFCRWKAGTLINGGCVIWGAFTGAGPGGMADIKVPFMQLEGELDFGAARTTKMAPYFRASEEAGDQAMLRNPVIVIPDIDHSDMCKGFEVVGDLPSDTDPETANKRLAKATSSFMEYHVLQDEVASDDLRNHIAFTKTLMDPINAALDMEKGSWCDEVMEAIIADDLSSQVTVRSTYGGEFSAPTAVLDPTGDMVTVTVSANSTDNEGVWPPGQAVVLGAFVGDKPPVARGTASSLGCRMVKRTVVAELLGKSATEPVDACAKANEKAMEWAKKNAPARVMERYARESPCKNCNKGVQTVQYKGDVMSDSVDDFKLSELAFELDELSWTMSSSSLMSDEEHSCMLLSPARALDFLMFDAYTANLFSESRPIPPTDIAV